MTLHTPWAIDGKSTDSQEARLAMSSLLSSTGGLYAAGGLEITQKGTPDLHVLVKGGTPSEGAVWVPGTASGNQGQYFCWNDATVELALTAAPGGTYNRWDTLVARVYDNPYDSSGKVEWALVWVKGSEESGVTSSNLKGIGAVPVSSYVLGYVFVEKNAASIVTGDIKNVASACSLGMLQKPMTKVEHLTQEEIASASGSMQDFGLADEVSLYLPKAGILWFMFHGTFVVGTGGFKIAAFLNGTQIASPANSGSTMTGGAGTFEAHSYVSAAGTVEIFTFNSGYPGDSSTGQVVGQPVPVWGPEGTSVLKVRYEATSGSTLKGSNRRLYAWVTP